MFDSGPPGHQRKRSVGPWEALQTAALSLIALNIFGLFWGPSYYWYTMLWY
jgi:hypothetical protein